MELALLIIFALSIGFIFLYSLIQLSLIVAYLRSKKKSKPAIPTLAENEFPVVTVQLPIYNELYVVERLIDKVCAFDYPKELLEIQILDDSNDETVEVIAAKVAEYKNEGFDIQHIRRQERTGYKAGALKYGTQLSKGEFIAIFDADFLPSRSFLKETLPYFTNPQIGVVQTKWTYTNADYSFLTKEQEFGLNAHFSIEQVGRNSEDHFINFNGTAGIWRKDCIEDAGGWEADTLTEDLDLSYRAQLKGWKFKYLEDVESPSELPVEINALKAQQFRWTKGAAECVRKNLSNVWRSKTLSVSTKIQASFHLLNSSVFIFVMLLSLLATPVTLIKSANPEYIFVYNIAGFFMISWIILGAFYWVSYSYDKQEKGKLLISFLWKFPLFLAISMGLSLHNSLAVIEGYIGKKSPFVRTPKFNINDKDDRWETNKYIVKKVGALTFLEGVLFVYFVFGLRVAIVHSDFGILPMITLLIVGYGTVFLSSIVHWKRSVKQLKYGEAF